MADRESTTAGEVTDALNNVSNGTAPGKPPRDEAKYQAARERGWVEPQNFDYEAAVAKNADLVAKTTGDEPMWAHKSRRYEFDQDLGDVGPEIPELEQELFLGKFRMSAGIKFNK